MGRLYCLLGAVRLKTNSLVKQSNRAQNICTLSGPPEQLSRLCKHNKQTEPAGDRSSASSVCSSLEDFSFKSLWSLSVIQFTADTLGSGGKCTLLEQRKLTDISLLVHYVQTIVTCQGLLLHN